MKVTMIILFCIAGVFNGLYENVDASMAYISALIMIFVIECKDSIIKNYEKLIDLERINKTECVLRDRKVLILARSESFTIYKIVETGSVHHMINSMFDRYQK